MSAQKLPAPRCASLRGLRQSGGCDTLVQRRLHRGSSRALAPYGLRRDFRLRSISSEDPQVAELMKAANALMEKLGTAERQLSGASRPVDDSQEQTRHKIMKLVCDESSCVIVPVAEDAKSPGPAGSFIGSSGQAVSEAHRPRDFFLSEGEGWKLGYDRNPINTNAFTALVGSGSWSVSMTKREFSDFIQLLKKLQRSIATLHTCGEWGEAPRDGRSAESSLELQTECIWMEARAPQKQLFDLTKIFQQGLGKRAQAQHAAFHLRFIVNAPKDERQREFEGQFSPDVVMRLLEHLESYPPSLDTLQSPPILDGSGQSAAAGFSA